MESEVFTWLADHYPTIFIIVVLIVGAVFVTKAILKVISRVEKVEKSCDTIDGKIVPKLDSISKAVNGMVVYLSIKDKDMNADLFTIQSPRQLSVIGKDLLQLTGGKKYIDDHQDLLLSMIEQRTPASALDVENQAPIVVLNVADSPDFKPIKDYIFNNPEYKRGPEGLALRLNIGLVANVMGIYLRDLYLRKHPEVA
jgi:hypothetical protein